MKILYIAESIIATFLTKALLHAPSVDYFPMWTILHFYNNTMSPHLHGHYEPPQLAYK